MSILLTHKKCTIYFFFNLVKNVSNKIDSLTLQFTFIIKSIITYNIYKNSTIAVQVNERTNEIKIQRGIR